VASPDGRDGSVTVHADATLHIGSLAPGQAIESSLSPGRLTYVYLARGSASVNGQALTAGDAAAIRDEALLRLDDGRDAELLVFDLAP
jgi:redox-sensitive bicupin YhaK (pirin superfamily)